MGKLKKVGIGFGIVILSFFVLAAIGGSVPDSEYPSEIDYDKMSNSQLSAMAVDWDYRDLMRNFDNYENQIIFVDGTVTKTQRDMGSLTLCIDMGTFSCDEHMFVNVNDSNWLDDENEVIEQKTNKDDDKPDEKVADDKGKGKKKKK